MPLLSISEVAQQAGLRTSALRYYEQIGILPPAERIGGQRRYDSTALQRLAVIQRARQTGFTLEEIRQLFFGFRNNTPASKRWQRLSRRKLKELAEQADQIKTMQRLLHKLEGCRCGALEECGKKMLEKKDANMFIRFSSTRKRPGSKQGLMQ